jgi:hypothetical protein
MLVLVEDSTETLVPSYIQVGDLVWISDRCGQRPQRACVRDAPMGPVPVIEGLEVAESMQQMLPAQEPDRSRRC